MTTHIPKLSPVADDSTLDALADAVMRRRALGRSEYLRWLVGLAMAAALSYFTTIATMDKSISQAKTTEEAHFQEVLRRLDVMQADIRELRGRP